MRVGEQLAQSVRQPVVGFALRAARAPAYLAGFGTLQQFLERGFQAFSHLGTDPSLLATIRARESALREALARAGCEPVQFMPVSDAEALHTVRGAQR